MKLIHLEIYLVDYYKNILDDVINKAKDIFDIIKNKVNKL